MLEQERMLDKKEYLRLEKGWVKFCKCHTHLHLLFEGKRKRKKNSYRHFLVSTVISHCYYIVWPKWLHLFYPWPDVKQCKKSLLIASFNT